MASDCPYFNKCSRLRVERSPFQPISACCSELGATAFGFCSSIYCFTILSQLFGNLNKSLFLEVSANLFLYSCQLRKMDMAEGCMKKNKKSSVVTGVSLPWRIAFLF